MAVTKGNSLTSNTMRRKPIHVSSAKKNNKDSSITSIILLFVLYVWRKIEKESALD